MATFSCKATVKTKIIVTVEAADAEAAKKQLEAGDWTGAEEDLTGLTDAQIDEGEGSETYDYDFATLAEDK